MTDSWGCCACRFWFVEKDCPCMARLDRHHFCDVHKRDLLEGIDSLERQTIRKAEHRCIVANASRN